MANSHRRYGTALLALGLCAAIVYSAMRARVEDAGAGAAVPLSGPEGGEAVVREILNSENRGAPEDRIEIGSEGAQIRVSTDDAREGHVVFAAVLWAPSIDRFLEVQVVGGRWEGALDPSTAWQVYLLKDEWGACSFVQQGSLNEGVRTCTLEVAGCSTWILHVFDAITGEDLESVTLTSGEQEITPNLALKRDSPVATSVLANGESSPITITEESPAGKYSVTSPGYETLHLFRNGFQTEVNIGLLKSANLRVYPDVTIRSIANDREDNLQLEISGPGGRILYNDRYPADPVVSYDSIPVGQYSVQVYLPYDDDDRYGGLQRGLLFQSFLELEPGETRDVLVEYIPEAAESTLELHVFLPNSGRRNFQFEVMREYTGGESLAAAGTRADFSSADGSDALWAVLPGLAEGDYRLELLDFGYTERFRLEGTLPITVLVDLSDYAEVRVNVPEGLNGWWGNWASVNSDAAGNFRQIGNRATNSFWCMAEPVELKVRTGTQCSQVFKVSPRRGEVVTVDVPSLRDFSYIVLGALKNGGHLYANGPEIWKGLRVEHLEGTGSWIENNYGTKLTRALYGPGEFLPDWSRIELILTLPGSYRVSSTELGFNMIVEATPAPHLTLLQAN